MTRFLVNFATEEFYQSQNRLNLSAKKHGIDKVFSYTDKIIRKTQFYRENKAIFKLERGWGYWLWKPYVILEALNKINYGDILFYLDSGVEIIKDISPLADLVILQNGILLFGAQGDLNREWIKRDCFVAMNCDSEKYWNGQHVNAAFQVYIKNDRSLSFVKEWLDYCRQLNIVSDLPNTLGRPNLPEFRCHLHDQSILSLLAAKYGCKIFRDPSQWGDVFKKENLREPNDNLWRYRGPYQTYSDSPYSDSEYQTIFYHHRKKSFCAKILKLQLLRLLYQISARLKKKSKKYEQLVRFIKNHN